MGNGWYSENLSYKDWWTFNNAQRIHLNFLEAATPVLLWILIGGLTKPWNTVYLGAANIVGRVLYHLGYSFKGPSGRKMGFVIAQFSGMGLFAMAIMTSLRLLGFN
eukprot:CAMPEP_0202958572 /NCGR_PEP_ID=MMETSP1396-20130829/2890_1 /ASSEMBLY_ACC=CAM_ASM_000872 /TAXON_ID= /ORGANISM="Pseudokeronopsis sp., Strain Brazil" /LENGTH=105 /DNA_ID=CAMNT_0049676721 /DNA_START=200 /DNA_END=514 /DNA_ORIENTATION=+